MPHVADKTTSCATCGEPNRAAERHRTSPVTVGCPRQMRESLADYQNELAAALPEIEAWAARSRAALRTGELFSLPLAWSEW